MSSADTGTPSTTPTSTSSPVTSTSPNLPPPIVPTTSPTTSSTATTSSSSSSSVASSSSDSKTGSSSTSSTASSPSSTASTTPSSTIKTSITTTSSAPDIPAVITEVSTTFVSGSQTIIPTAASVKNTTTGNAFFENKGAVAGVFSVVGLIGLVLIIALITNIIRRREARKFDKELFLATQEAAATAPNLNFLDDEDDEPKRNGYSDVSHGTYGQPPMQAYNMRHMGGHVDEYDPGAAGIGLPRGGYPLEDGRPLYPQFAMPRDAMAQYDSYADGPFGRGNMALSAAASAPYSRSPPPRDPSNLGRSKSGSTIATHPSYPSNPSTPSHTSHYPQQYSVGQTVAPPSLPNPYTEEHPPRKEPLGESADDGAAYGGYVEDDVEEEAPKRVLKIANES